MKIPNNIITAAIKRIQQRKSAVPSAEHLAGFTAGHEWATSWMNPIELERIAQLASSDIVTSDKGDAGAWLATQMGEAMGFNPSHPDFVFRVRSVLFPDNPDAVYSPAFVTGYLEGAAEVWRAFQAKGSSGDGGQY